MATAAAAAAVVLNLILILARRLSATIVVAQIRQTIWLAIEIIQTPPRLEVGLPRSDGNL